MKKLICLFLLMVTPVALADYPNRPVKIIVPFGPGGGNDIIARVLAQELTNVWKQSVTVENRPGADSLIGTAAVAKADPDGHTLLLNQLSGVAAAQAIRTDNQFNWETDLKVLAHVGQAPPFVVVVSSKNPATSLRELQDQASKKPLTFGSAGVGGALYLYGAELAAQMGVKSVHVPYKGTAPAMLDVANGSVDYIVIPQGPVAPLLTNGTVKILAVAHDKPVSNLATIRTVKSSGYPNFPTLNTRYNIIAPSAMPVNIASKISSDVDKAVAAVRQDLLSRNLIVDEPSPDSSILSSLSLQEGRLWWNLARTHNTQ